MELQFSLIRNESIFRAAFETLDENNGKIVFKKQKNGKGGMAVVYAPNGVGKSSLAKVLGSKESSDDIDFMASDDKGLAYTPESSAFHIIADQIQRNVIKGDESQYLVGKDIKREYELRKKVGDGFTDAFRNSLPDTFKNKYKVTKIKDELLKRLKTVDLKGYGYILSIVNKSQRGETIDRAEFISFIENPANEPSIDMLGDECRDFVIKDYYKNGTVEKIISLDIESIKKSPQIKEIEQHDDALVILKKYHDMDICVVCDNDEFDGDALLKKKEDNKKKLYESLDKDTRRLLDEVAMDPSLSEGDPFDIKRVVIDFIETGDPTSLSALKDNLTHYVTNICNEMIVDLIKCFDGTTVIKDFKELSKLRETTPELDSEDLLYIQEVISENIDRDIRIERDNDNDRNFRLLLGDQHILNVERDKMNLSTGEQNFISLAFELLLAKNGDAEYIILDDPISSFDSIYKNKIAFSIVKFLEDKKQIILTHNLDLVRLLEHQVQGCYNLYILNNVDGGRNGFIPVNNTEKELLINLAELIRLFSNKEIIAKTVTDRKLFLISMVPFIRGYAHIRYDSDNYYVMLSELMHGYESSTLDLVKIYNHFFGEVFEGTEEVSNEDVLTIDCDNLDFFDSVEYPLLAETLRQSVIYYYLRMKTENKLVNIFKVKIKDDLMLSQIILQAFKCEDEDDAEYKYKRQCRVFFTSRKTLLNEFDHFEGNLNIFQPAIDITSVKLKKEVDDIECKLAELEERYGD